VSIYVCVCVQFTVKTVMKRNERGVYPVITPDLTPAARLTEQRYVSECRILDKLNKVSCVYCMCVCVCV
jgi:hypothetical protein